MAFGRLRGNVTKTTPVNEWAREPCVLIVYRSVHQYLFVASERASVIIKLDILVKVSFYIPRYILPSKVLSCLLNYY